MLSELIERRKGYLVGEIQRGQADLFGAMNSRWANICLKSLMWTRAQLLLLEIFELQLQTMAKAKEYSDLRKEYLERWTAN